MSTHTRVVNELTGMAIQQAADSLDGGGCLQLMPGTYEIAQTVLLGDNIRLQGAGIGKTVLRLRDNANCHVLSNRDHTAGNRRIQLSGLTIAGNARNQRRLPSITRTSFCHGAYFVHVDDVVVESVEISDVFQSGLHFTHSTGIRIDRLHAIHLGWSGISSSGASNVTITNAHISNAGLEDMHSGINLDGGSDIYVEAYVHSCSGNAIMLDCKFGDVRRAVVKSIARHSRRGIALSGSGTHTMSTVLVEHCDASSNREVGVLISNASGIIVHECTMDSNLDYGILLQGRQGATNCIVSNCRIINNGIDIGEIHASAHNYIVNTIISPGISPTGAPREPRQPAAADAPRASREPARSESRTSGEHHAALAASPNGSGAERFHDACRVCGVEGIFEANGQPTRESHRCPSCQASLRYQGQAEVIMSLFAREGSTSIEQLVREQAFHSLAVYEPGVLGPFRRYLCTLPAYTTSAYWPDVAEGHRRDGLECQNLMSLTYPDESFDLVITSDIFEHVRKPYQAFEEIRRVLRPGGIHVFSIPLLHPMPANTVSRVDTSGADDIFVLEPHYHGGPGNGKHLVYTDFGADMLEALAAMGLETTAVQWASGDDELRRLLTFYSVKQQPLPPRERRNVIVQAG